MIERRRAVRRRIRVVGAGLLGAAALLVACEAAAAKNPIRSARQCRRAVGAATRLVSRAGLRNIDACHRARDRGRTTRPDCNLIDGSLGNASAYQRTRNKYAQFIVPERCSDADTVLPNYPGGTVGTLVELLFPAVQGVLEQSGDTLQGAPSFVGDKSTVRQLKRCHETIGAARSDVLVQALTDAVRCQLKRDAHAQTFGPLDPACSGSAGRVAARAGARIAKRCNGISGAAVGTCAALPDCVVAAAESQAAALARMTYGGPGNCGDGFVDLDEDCDDGNHDPGDGCEPDCRDASSGECSNDGNVDSGEECDDGNNRDDDDCISCVTARCSDGFVDVQEPATEECDDGNTDAGDGCTDCRIDGKLCRADGIIANVVFDYQPSITGDILGMFAQLAYAPPLSLPGSGPASTVRQRVTSQLPTNVRFIPSDNDSNGDAVDDLLRILVTVDAGQIPPGPFGRVQFDCPQGTFVRPADLPCSLDGVSDSSGQLIPPERLEAEGVHCRVDSLEGDTPLPTTTIPGATTTTTTATTPLPTTTTSSVSTTTTSPVATTTTTAGVTTSTAPGSSTTSTTLPAAFCGDNQVTAPETCDDGNTVDTDFCPADCQVDFCQPEPSEVVVNLILSSPDVAAVTLFLDYPEGRADLQGTGTAVAPGRVTGPGTATTQPNDFDHALRLVVFDLFNFGTTQVATVRFNRCQGAPAPTAGEFSCALEGPASDENLAPVPGVTCTVSIP